MSELKHNLVGKFGRCEIELSTGPLSFFAGGDGPVYLHQHGASHLIEMDKRGRYLDIGMTFCPGRKPSLSIQATKILA